MHPRPKSYACLRAVVPPAVDGDLDSFAWKEAPWSDDFIDIQGDRMPKPQYRTRVKMLWDDEYWYFGAELEEPHLWGTLTERESIIFQDNDFEIFIDPDGDNHEYYEFEINALGTTWDLMLIRPYMDGGPPVTCWDIQGLKSAVKLRGTINDPTDIDEGWSVTVAIPWTSLKECAHRASPPQDGDQWRVNFSRVQWALDIIDGKYLKRPGLLEDNWVWTPQGAIDMHRPERWGYVQFSNQTAGLVAISEDPTYEARERLIELYYRQRDFWAAHGCWARKISELGLEESHIVLESTRNLYEASVPCGNDRLHIRQDRKIWLASSDQFADTRPTI